MLIENISIFCCTLYNFIFSWILSVTILHWITGTSKISVFILHGISRHRLLSSWPLLYHQYWNSGTSSGTSIRMGKYIWTWYSLRISLPIKTAGHTSFCFTKKTALMLLFDVRQSRVNKSGKAIKQYYLQFGPGNKW